MVFDRGGPILRGVGDEIIDFALRFSDKIIPKQRIMLLYVADRDGAVCEVPHGPRVKDSDRFSLIINNFNCLRFNWVMLNQAHRYPTGKSSKVLYPVVKKDRTVACTHIHQLRGVGHCRETTVFC